MEKKEVAIDNPVTTAGLTIVPVVQVLLNSGHVKGNASFFGLKQPIAVIVVSQIAKRAFRITGEEISIEQLEKEVPGVKVTTEGISSSSK